MKSKIVGIVIGVVVVCGADYGAMSLTRVGQGEVGVVYSMADGVQDETLDPGFHFVGPFDKVKDYPVAQQQLVLSNNPEDYNEKEHGDWHVDAPAEADAEVKRIEAEAKAERTRIAAQAEADANNTINSSITENLIKMKEMEARLEHGWVTVEGASTVVADEK